MIGTNLGILAGDDTVEPLLEVAGLHTGTLLHLDFLEPTHGRRAADTTLLLDLLLDTLGKLLEVGILEYEHRRHSRRHTVVSSSADFFQ